jgi:O-antigen ligase/tetratricopeptide (TPR) repeat protein
MKKDSGEKNKGPGKMGKESAARIARAESFLEQLQHDKGLWFIIFFAIVMAYLLLNQGGSIDLERQPVWAFRAFAFGGFIIFSILDFVRIRDNLRKINVLAVLPISIVAIIVTSNIVSIRPFETVEESMNILAYAAMAFLCWTYIDSLSKLRQFLEIILVAGFLIAFWGLYLFYGALWGYGETRPLSSLFYWHNPCAGFLLLIWPVMLAQFYSLRRKWQTFLILYIFYITFTAYGLTLSRGGWLAGFLPFFLIPFVLSRKKIMVNWRPLILIGLYFLSAIPFVLKYRGRFFQPIIDRWNQMRPDDYSVVGRFEFWDIALRVWKEHPITGIGFNTFGYYYVNYQTNPQYYTKDPHSLYIRFMLEGGIAGILVILSILWIYIQLIMMSLKAGPGKMLTVYRVGLLAGIGGELLHMAIDFDWTFPIIPMLLVCQLAVVSRTFTYPKVEQEMSVDEWEIPVEPKKAPGFVEGEIEPRGFFIRPLPVWQSLAAILLIANILGYASMDLYEKGRSLILDQRRLAGELANQRMTQAQQEAFRSQTQEIPTPDEFFDQARLELLDRGISYWERSLKYNPWNWYPLKDLLAYSFVRARDSASSGDYEQAEEFLNKSMKYGERLLKVTPHRPASYYDMGQTLILAGQAWRQDDLVKSGLNDMLHAIELDPVNIPKYYLGVAQYYKEDGEIEKSLEYLQKLEEIFVPTNTEGGVDFSALKGKSLARQDWIDITETCRDAWWLQADILQQLGRRDEAMTTLYNGLNTPVGGGEQREEQFNLGILQLPFLLKIAEQAAEDGDWNTVKLRTSSALDVINENEMYGSPESEKANELYYEARSHLEGTTVSDTE